MQKKFADEMAPNRISRGCRLRVVGGFGLGLLGCYAAVANAAIKTDVGVDYRATGFYVQSNSFKHRASTKTASDSNDNGFAQYLRIKANFKDEKTGVEVHTRVEVSGDRWSGDSRGYQTTGSHAFNTANNGDNVRTDLAFVQIPLGKSLLRVGRQESNWNNSFLVGDDRRDRIIALHKFGNLNAFVAYDRRADTQAFLNEDNGNMNLVGVVTPLGSTDFTLGVLYVHWWDNFSGNYTQGINARNSANAVTPTTDTLGPYVLSNTNIISPYVQGKLGPVDVTTGFNYLFGGKVDQNATPAQDDYFSGNAWSEYFRLGTTVGMFDLKAQYVGTQNGGLISSTFDTYSSVINSNPESTASPTSVYNMGGYLGAKGYNQNLYIGQVVANLTSKVALSGSVGALNIEIPGSAAPVRATGSDTSMVYDLQGSYQLNRAVRFWATVGWLEKNKVGQLSGNSLLGSFPNGGDFSSNGVVAGSLNLGVSL